MVQPSTFSWWTAWLSDAWEIHYPLAGLLHPAAKMEGFDNDVPGELTVYDEERYVYHDLFVASGGGTSISVRTDLISTTKTLTTDGRRIDK